jgi:hypothetical protein
LDEEGSESKVSKISLAGIWGSNVRDVGSYETNSNLAAFNTSQLLIRHEEVDHATKNHIIESIDP